MKIYNTDCYEFIKTLEDKSIDLLITDPPYELDLKGQGKNKFCRVYDSQRVQLKELINSYDIETFANLIIPKMKTLNFYFFCSRTQIYRYIEVYVKKYKLSYDILTWHKTNPMPLYHNKYMSDTEFILFFRKNAKIHFDNYEEAKTYFLEPINNKDKKLWHHPTIKPLSIVETLVRNSSEKGELILDPFMGSGTTGVACKNLSRDFIGCEIDKNYFNIAKERIGIE